jgi:hypothetical protein
LGVAGSINQSGSALSGAVHVSSFFEICFDQLPTVGLTGALTGSSISLTSTSVYGQVIAITGSVINNTFTGTYTITGGCANGSQGNVTGFNVPSITGLLTGTFKTSGGETFNVDPDVTQLGSASSEGSFGVTGNAVFSNTSCFTSGTLTPGTFPSGSFIMGTSVALEIKTANGIVAFLGTLNPDRSEISGAYMVSGGTCDQTTGTGTLAVLGPWTY